MANTSRYRIKTILLHLVVWTSYALFNYFLNLLQNFGEIYVLDNIGKYSIAAVIFYANILVILPNFFRAGRYFYYGLSLLGLLAITFVLKEFLYSLVFPLWGYPKESPYTLFESFLMHIWWWFQYSLFGLGYWVAVLLIQKEREKLHVEGERNRIEKEKIMTEYALLKAQINPHFLYNALNSLYSKSLTISGQLSSAILCLSEILRYSYDKIEDLDGYVLLSDEVRQIERIIEFNRLRFPDINVVFECDLISGNARIIPFVLGTLVENAFKHGDFISSNTPVLITLKYFEVPSSICFTVVNKIAKTPKAATSGMGLENIQRRLELAYNSDFILDIDKTKDLYSVSLSVNF